MHSYKCCSPSRELEQIEELADLLKLVAERSRLKILCILRQGEHCVCELMNHLEMSQSLISHHLRDLREAGIVDKEKRGVRMYYFLTEKGRKITKLVLQIK